MTSVRALLALVLAVALGCSEQEFQPPDRETQIGEAGAAFDLAAFDTLTWTSDSVRSLEGNVVWAARCRNCHGQLGDGATPYGEERGLDVPSPIPSRT